MKIREPIEIDENLLAEGHKLFSIPPRSYSKGWLLFCYAAGFLGGFGVAAMIWWTP